MAKITLSRTDQVPFAVMIEYYLSKKGWNYVLEEKPDGSNELLLVYGLFGIDLRETAFDGTISPEERDRYAEDLDLPKNRSEIQEVMEQLTDTGAIHLAGFICAWQFYKGRITDKQVLDFGLEPFLIARIKEIGNVKPNEKDQLAGACGYVARALVEHGELGPELAFFSEALLAGWDAVYHIVHPWKDDRSGVKGGQAPRNSGRPAFKAGRPGGNGNNGNPHTPSPIPASDAPAPDTAGEPEENGGEISA